MATPILSSEVEDELQRSNEKVKHDQNPSPHIVTPPLLSYNDSLMV